MKTILLALVFGVIVSSCNAIFSEEDPIKKANKVLNDSARKEAKKFGVRSISKSKKYTDDRGLYCLDYHYLAGDFGRIYQTVCYLGTDGYELKEGFSTR